MCSFYRLNSPRSELLASIFYLGFIAEFETYPHWVPAMDTSQQFESIVLKKWEAAGALTGWQKFDPPA